MLKSSHYQHGGNLDTVERTYGIKSSDIIDFSANVNPLGISPHAKNAIISNVEIISKYPDEEYIALKKSIAHYTEASFDDVLVGNGSTELISKYIHLASPKNALIIGPTYSEYEREIDLLGGDTTYYPLKEGLNFQLDLDSFLLELDKGYDLLILCNPNNPTGTAIPVNQLRQIMHSAKNNGTLVMIDETYIEFAKNPLDYTSIGLINEFKNLFVIRGISKFFSAPGLRLGYGLCSNEEIKKKINKSKDPWAINSIANMAAQKMFEDNEYIQRTHLYISKERQYFYEELKKIPSLKVYESEANFILCKILDHHISSKELFISLLKEHLMIRDASSFPFLNEYFIRFCFMLHQDNVKLLNKLRQLLSNN